MVGGGYFRVKGDGWGQREREGIHEVFIIGLSDLKEKKLSVVKNCWYHDEP